VNYFFAPKARLEHLEHIAYYESRQKGLGARYLSSFDTSMIKVCEAPQRYKDLVKNNFPKTDNIPLRDVICIKP
jgi:hypothetical protein